jgi:phosphopantothenoylcysteine decarboxylase / phosphopantothenate---cysteine ligase
VVEPETGMLAGGDEGAGRLAAPDVIVAAAVAMARPDGGDLTGRRVLVTAGGTREPIDPVRFIGNRSSGKMGYAVAAAAAARGADVVLVTTQQRPAPPGVEALTVATAEEMADAVLGRFPELDAVVMAAAVADFRPKAPADEKLKKGDGVPEVILEPTRDILRELGETKAPGQALVGFAAETAQVVEQAAAKLASKRVDLMVGNDVSAPDAGFEVDTNRAVLLDAAGGVETLPLLAKTELADRILDRVRDILEEQV